MGYVVPQPPDKKTGKSVCGHRVGVRPVCPRPSSSRASAMTSMSMSAKARPAACCVTVFPTSRWKNTYIDKRVAQMEGEGVVFHYDVHVGVDKTVDALREEQRCV